MKQAGQLELQSKIDHARALLEKKQFDAALDAYLKLLEEGCRFAAAPKIAWIYQYRPNNDIEKAIEYYKIGSDENSAFSQHALGGLYYRRGDIENAIHYYKLSAQNGSVHCSYILYRLFTKKGEIQTARNYFLQAASQRDPLAIRDLSFEHMRGRHGSLNIFRGIGMYFENLPRLLRFAFEKSGPAILEGR